PPPPPPPPPLLPSVLPLPPPPHAASRAVRMTAAPMRHAEKLRRASCASSYARPLPIRSPRIPYRCVRARAVALNALSENDDGKFTEGVPMRQRRSGRK